MSKVFTYRLKPYATQDFSTDQPVAAAFRPGMELRKILPFDNCSFIVHFGQQKKLKAAIRS